MRQRRLRQGYQHRIAQPAARAELRPPVIGLPEAAHLPESLRAPAERIRLEAEAILEHRVDFLGSGLVQLGPEIDWQRDFKSGYQWPPAFYQDLEVTRLVDDSDAKVPWELSRGHQLLTLARAACLFEDERFALELERQLAAWIAGNPPGYGINWANPMEVAIRAINWIWAIGTLESRRPLAPSVRSAVTKSLQSHGRHIAANLEGGPTLRSNHYVADILGLLVLGTFVGDDPAARRWFAFARRRFEREMLTQVHEDGVDFEASLPYHGLVLEMFLLAWLVAELGGRPLSARYRRRLVRMLEVSRSVRHPDGRIPIFGDQDSGRVLPAGFERPATHDNLLGLGAALMNLPRLTPGSPHEEVAWTLGLAAWKRLDARPQESRPITTAFPDGGLYVLDGGGTHLVVRWGTVGQNGNGGHAHNDLSSYELSRKAPIIVDSGTYLYTADVAARDEFRAARAHNVTLVDGLDMHPIPIDEPFRMPAQARHRVEKPRNDERLMTLTGFHDGFRRAGAHRIQRRIVVDRTSGDVEIDDEVTGGGERHQLESFVHLVPGATAESRGPDAVLVTLDDLQLTVSFTGAEAVEIEPGWVSEAYGARERALVIRAHCRTSLPARLGYRIVAADASALGVQHGVTALERP